MPKSGEHKVNGVDSFFKVRPSKNNIREGESISFIEDGVLIKQEKRQGVVYETRFEEQKKVMPTVAPGKTRDVTNVIMQGSSSGGGDLTGITAGTGLTGGGASGNITLNIDSTVTTLTGSQTLTNKTLTSPVINTGVSGTAILDENDMSSDSDTKLATQQSIKAYVDSEISGIAAPANATITLSPGAGLAAIGDFTTNQSSNETLTIAVDGVLEDLDTLGAAASDGQFIVATGSGAFAYESGSTARTSLGLGTLATLSSISDSQVASDANIAITKLAASSITVADGSSSTAISLGNTITFSGTSNEVTVGESSGTITVGLPDDVTIAGDLTVNGDVVTVTAENIVVQDPLIKLAKDNNSSDSLDIGFYGLYDTTGSQDLYAGLFRDANDSGKFKLFKDLQDEPTTTVDVAGTGYAKATLVADLEGNVTGNVTGNAGTATKLANARDITLTGDITGVTPGAGFDGSAAVSIDATIASTAVEGSMLNNNVISGQTNMTGDVADADELMISDAGTLKRIDFSVFRDAIFNDISGDATVASGGALTIAADSVALGTDTTGNYVATVADSGTGGITVANSGSESAAVTVELDINGLTAATLASGDFLAFSDESATGDPTKKESIDDIATLFAGTGLTASSAVINLDISGLNTINEAQTAAASDTILVFDNDASEHKQMTLEDLEDAIGGTGTVTNVVAGTGLSGGGTTTATLDLDFSELTDMTGDISGSTEFILQNGTTESRKAASEIDLSAFNNDITDNNFTDADHSKLDGIEASATADQTASEILTAIKTVDGATSGLDADLLDGQHGSHYLNAANLTGTIDADRLPSDIDISSNTNLSAGTNITLSGDTLNVDDAFLINSGNDTTSGTITAAGFITAGSVTADTLVGNSNNTNTLLFDDDQTGASNMVTLQSINHINVMTDGNNNGTGNFRVYNGSYDTDTADLAFQVSSTSNATFYGDVTLSGTGDLTVPGVIKHTGDSDTYIFFTNDRIRLYAGNTLKLDTNETYLTSSSALPAGNLTGSVDIDRIPTAAVTNGDTDNVPTGDHVYDFVTGLGYLSSVPNHSASLITSGTLNNARLNTDMELSASAPRYKLTESDATNTPTWWMVADGGNYSIRLNNSGTYPLQITTNGENNAVSSLTLGYNTSITGTLETNNRITTTGTGGFTIGNYAGRDRIQNVSNSFSFLTDGNAYAGMTFGTVTAGTWQGTAIANAYVADLPASKITSGELATARVNWDSTDKTVRWDNGRGYHGNPRSMSIGYSGGNYGQFGYNIDFTTTSGQHTYAFNDIATRCDLYDGLLVYTSVSGGSAGSTISWTELMTLRNGEFSYKQNTIWHAGNDGGGSGLDADLLDGIQASQFLRSDTSDSVGGDLDLGSGNVHIKKTAGNNTNNYAAVEVYSAGTADNQAAIAIQQQTSEGDTIIFADYEPHVEWGISAENGANRIDFTGGSSSPSLGTRTFKNNSGNDRTAYRKMSVRLDTGNVDIAGNLTVANGSAYAGDSTSGVLSTGSWYGDLGSNGFERVAGLSHDGGEFVIVEKGGRVSTLVDGNYFAYESAANAGGGFYSSTSSNYANAPGIRASGASELYVIQADGGASDLKLSSHLILPYGEINDSGTDVVIKATNAFVAQSGGANNRYVINSSGSHSIYGNTYFSSPMSCNYGAVFNETSNDSDFRVESNGKTHAIHVDAGADKVNIDAAFWSNYGHRIGGLSQQGGFTTGSNQLYTTNNIMTFADNTNWDGAMVINTNITRASARMCTITVKGYGYGNQSFIDFDVNFYTYSGVNGQDGVAGYPYAARIMDRGNDKKKKFVGINSSGKVAIAIGDYNDSNKYYYGFKVSLDNHLNGSGATAYQEWTVTKSTTDGFGWLHKDEPARQIAAISQQDATYTKLLDPNGSVSMYLGGTADGNNYYQAGEHRFRNYAGSAYYLRIGSGHISGSGVDLHLRRDTTNDDMIEINASDTRIYGDADERMRIGSTIYLFKPTQVNNSLSITRNANPDGDATMALNLSGSYGGGIHFTDTKHSGIWCLGNGTEMHFGVGGSSYASPGSDQGLFMMEDNGDFHANEDVIAFSSSVGSDKKFKKNIKDTSYGLSDVMKMRAVEYDWIEKRKGKHDIGVIAQEIEEIIPEVVQDVKSIGGSEGTHKVVDYGKLASVLIKAIQEQQQQINELKEKLNG